MSNPPPDSYAPPSPSLTPFGDVSRIRRREPQVEPPARASWKLNAFLFALTVPSVFLAGALFQMSAEELERPWSIVRALPRGWTFAVPLLSILVVHELGHYIAARIHRVDASLPYFLPLPFVGPLGTLGAVIAMRGRIRSRNALFDIGASGPLAGLVVALPVLAVGLSLSTVSEQTGEHFVQEGQSLLYLTMKRLFVGPIPEGHDVYLHPTAFAGWAGLLITMINLIPWGQLDGGHVAYALFGKRQDRYARLVRALLLPIFLYNVALFILPVLRGASRMPLGVAVANSLFWLTWFVVTGIIGWVAGGPEHPRVDPGELSPKRRALAIGTLALFVLLFMPTPLAMY